MDKTNPIYEQTYRNYLIEIAALDLELIAQKLGGKFLDGAIELDFYGFKYRISAGAILNNHGREAGFAECVVLCKYLLMCPEQEPHEKNWVAYNNFKDAAPFAGAFVKNVEKPIARNFTGKLELLENACKKTFAKDPDMELNYQLVKRFEILPKVPVLLLFNDKDDEFPAESFVRFEERAKYYLDMECLAVIGWLLSDKLAELAGLAGDTLM